MSTLQVNAQDHPDSYPHGNKNILNRGPVDGDVTSNGCALLRMQPIIQGDFLYIAAAVQRSG